MDLILPWLSAGLALILILLYPARKLVQATSAKQGGALDTLYKIMRKTHLAIGIIIIPVVYLHCRISTAAAGVRSTLGAILLLLVILLALSYLIRKPLGNRWKRVHQVLAGLLTVVILCHAFIEF